jgi:glycosyltransferase involved in cell wall biosynthesis
MTSRKLFYQHITANKDTPLISIILVCLNSVKSIEQTLLSIINLDYPKIELIVVDGESEDGTIDILKKYEAHINCLVIEKDNGIYDAMNKGLLIAKGDYIYFTGSDDIIVNSWMNLKGKLKSNNTIYYGNVYLPFSNRIYDGRFSFFKLLTKNISHQAIFYPRSVFKKYKYSDKYLLVADFHLNLLINSDRNFKFKYINLLIAVYSEKGTSTGRPDINFLNDHREIIKSNYCPIVYLYIWCRKVLSRWFRRK